MSKHTQGSWKVDGITELCIYDVDSRFIGLASITSIKGSNDTYNEAYEEAKANARLMAAAPELLEALEAIQKHWNNELFPIMETTKQAIAKAREEQNE